MQRRINVKKDSFKKKQIDNLDLKWHLLLLAMPMLLISILFIFVFPADELAGLKLLTLNCIYLVGYTCAYYIHKARLNRLWQHLEQVMHINDTTYELVHLSSHYHSEQSFLDALLAKAVSSIDDAEMGSIILVDKKTKHLHFECVIGLDIDALRTINFSLEETFEYRLTDGRCDRVVVINDMENINSDSTLSKEDQQTLLQASNEPIRSTLSSPIHIDGELYAMMNLDSSKADAFGDYDANLVSVLTSEAANAIALYQKSKKIETLATMDGLTQLYNRKKFDSMIAETPPRAEGNSFIVILDMDNLKPLNDELGHQAGDYALQTFAKHLKQMWSPQFPVARYGGDEFVALLQGDEATLTTQLEALEIKMKEQSPPISFSYGIAEYFFNWEKSFKEADLRMYSAKRAKKLAQESQHLSILD